MQVKRVFLIVLDSFGIGNAPDAEDFGDAGSDTLKSLTRCPFFSVPTLTKLGLFSINGTPDAAHGEPKARVCRLLEKSRGKDTTVGHWELAGIVSEKPFPTYPNGFPEEIMDAFCRATGRGYLCNRPYSGTEVIRDFGREHEQTGKFIVYTSADSVFQIASHESIIELSELYRACERARAILTGEHGVGRVIARPFTGAYPNYARTKNRHDYSLAPPKKTMLDYLSESGREVLAIGKIKDIFASRGITRHMPTGSNAEGMAALDSAIKEDFRGLCFCNLVDFDMLYGHRNDAPGYAKALMEFDAWLESFLPKLEPDDVLMITADHGCDPITPSTDHSRESVPYLVYGKQIPPGNAGDFDTFSAVAATTLDLLGIRNPFSHAKPIL